MAMMGAKKMTMIGAPMTTVTTPTMTTTTPGHLSSHCPSTGPLLGAFWWPCGGVVEVRWALPSSGVG
eukprot:277568-Pyramimonas_sp.AAC.1